MTDNKHHRTIQSFVRREGRITRGQQRALDELWPVYGLAPDTPLDYEAVFGRTAPRTLEIGIGNGEALAHIARLQPEHDFTGIEVHRPGVGHLLQLLERNGTENVRVYNDDAVKILKTCIPDNSVDRLFLFFPDPWHKKRHHKRRIVQPDFVELVADKLRVGGIFHMATDWEEYATHALNVLESSDRFRNCAGRGNWSEKPGYRPQTRFELRGRKLGHGVRDLLFERVQPD